MSQVPPKRQLPIPHYTASHQVIDYLFALHEKHGRNNVSVCHLLRYVSETMFQLQTDLWSECQEN
jgi:hypothetical protein